MIPHPAGPHVAGKGRTKKSIGVSYVLTESPSTITITVKDGCYPCASKRESIEMLTSKSLACQSVPYGMY